MLTDTPKNSTTHNIITNNTKNNIHEFSTPSNPISLPSWDPRSPMQNRTPINLIDPEDHPNHHDLSQVPLDSASPKAPLVVPPTPDVDLSIYNPLIDPRSPVFNGNRTPIQYAAQIQAPPPQAASSLSSSLETASTTNTPTPLQKVTKKKKSQKPKKKEEEEDNENRENENVVVVVKSSSMNNLKKSKIKSLGEINVKEKEMLLNHMNNSNQQKKVVITQKPIKRQIAFQETTNIIVD